jgi:hypothetical protein
MLEKLRKLLRQPIGIVAISFGLIPFFGAKEQPYEINFDQTINFFAPGPKWPVEKLLTPVQKQVYQQYGKPDMFRFLWSRTGELKMRETLQLEWTRKKLKEIPPHTWVYLQRNEEVVFTGNSFVTRPLTEAMQIVIKYGDPENVRDIGSGVSQWTFYSVGKIYTISGDKVVGSKDFPAMGSFHK